MLKKHHFLCEKWLLNNKKSCSDLLLFLLPLNIGIWITNTIHQWMGCSQRVLIFVSPKSQRQKNHFRMHIHCSGVWTGFSRTAENKTLKTSYWFMSLWFSFAGKESSRSLHSCNLSATEEQPPHLGTTFPRLPDSSNLNICPWGEARYLQQLMSAHSKRKFHAHPKLLQQSRGAYQWLSASTYPQPKRNATHAEVLCHRNSEAFQRATPNTFWKLWRFLRTKPKIFLDKTATTFRTIFVCARKPIKEISK